MLVSIVGAILIRLKERLFFAIKVVEVGIRLVSITMAFKYGLAFTGSRGPVDGLLSTLALPAADRSSGVVVVVIVVHAAIAKEPSRLYSL